MEESKTNLLLVKKKTIAPKIQPIHLNPRYNLEIQEKDKIASGRAIQTNTVKYTKNYPRGIRTSFLYSCPL